jgi:hypothetical protein
MPSKRKGRTGGGVRSGQGSVRTILLLHIISARPSKQSLLVRTFLKVYGARLLFFVSARTNKRPHHHGRSKGLNNLKCSAYPITKEEKENGVLSNSTFAQKIRLPQYGHISDTMDKTWPKMSSHKTPCTMGNPGALPAPPPRR